MSFRLHETGTKALYFNNYRVTGLFILLMKEMPIGTTSLVQATTFLVHAVQSFHQFLPYTIGPTYLSIKTINCQNMRTSFLQHKSISIQK